MLWEKENSHRGRHTIVGYAINITMNIKLVGKIERQVMVGNFVY